MSTPEEQFGAPLIDAPPHSELVASVIIPAKNEAKLLPRALGALAAQRGLPGAAFELLVLVNNSTDDSEAVVRQFAQEHSGLSLHVLSRDFPPEQAHIGSARRMLMDEAYRRLNASQSSPKLILSTDADSAVAPDWIVQNMREVRHGAAAVGGAIHLDPADRATLPHKVRQMQHKDDQYQQLTAWLEDRLDPQASDPWPRHQHHFGASLALTTDAYRLVGGLPPEQRLEDVALYQKLVRHDVPFRHSPQVQVFTSARLNGRVNVGLSEQLAQWQDSGHAGIRTPVASAEYLVRFFASRREFRGIWQESRVERCPRFDYAVDRFCRQSRLNRQRVVDALDGSYFGEAWCRLDLAAGLRNDLSERATQPLVSAVAELQQLREPSPAGRRFSRALRKDRADRIPA